MAYTRASSLGACCSSCAQGSGMGNTSALVGMSTQTVVAAGIGLVLLLVLRKKR